MRYYLISTDCIGCSVRIGPFDSVADARDHINYCKIQDAKYGALTNEILDEPAAFDVYVCDDMSVDEDREMAEAGMFTFGGKC